MAKETSAKKKKVTLEYAGETGETVFVAGTFNDWSVEEVKKGSKSKVMKEDKDKTGKYTINMFLQPGDYEYKFFCDGKWVEDTNAEVRKQNSFGTFNSVITVG